MMAAYNSNYRCPAADLLQKSSTSPGVMKVGMKGVAQISNFAAPPFFCPFSRPVRRYFVSNNRRNFIKRTDIALYLPHIVQ